MSVHTSSFQASLLRVFFVCMLACTPLPSLAASATFFGPIIPEGCYCKNQPIKGDTATVTSAPDFGCVLATVQNGINLGVSISIIITILYIAFGGVKMVTSAGNPAGLTEAKNVLINGAVGILLVLSSWLIVDFVMKVLYDPGSGYGPWNSILADNGNHMCLKASVPVGITTNLIETFTAPTSRTGTEPSTATGDELAVRNKLSAAGISVNKDACPAGIPFESVSGGCTTVGGFQQGTIDQVIQIKNICGSTEVTGGNELGHAGGTVSHSSGYKVDLATNIDGCITGGSGGYFTRSGSRSSDPLYVDKCGNEYVRENAPAHWDITVKTSCTK